MPFRSSLKNILSVSFIAIAALPVLIIGFVTLEILTRNLTEEITQKNYILAKSLSSEVQRFLDEPYAILGQIEEVVVNRKMIGDDRINEYLASTIAQFDFFNMIQILDHKGVIRHVAPYNRDYIGVQMSGQVSYQASLELDRPYWSPTFIALQTGEPTLTLTRQCRQCTLIGYLNLVVLNAIADKVKIGKHGYAIITDQQGTIIAHPKRSFVAQRLNIKNLNVITQGLSGNEGTFKYRFEGVDKLGSVAIVPQTGWLVVVLQPLTEAFAPVARIKYIFFVGTAVAMALALGLALLRLKKVLNPLSLLITKAKKIADGSYHFDPQPKSYTEIDTLAHNFEAMSQAVEAREDALRASEERISKINESFLNFGIEPLENINRLTQLCGELLDADFALYNRLDQGLLCSWGQWQALPGHKAATLPEGQICYDLIRHKDEKFMIVTNLADSRYAQTIPAIQAYGLKTYIGIGVDLRDVRVGSLCAVYQRDVAPSDADKQVMEILGAAIEIEEERKRAQEILRESEERYRTVLEANPDPVVVYDMEGQVTFFNRAFTEVFGWTLQERLGQRLDDFVPEEAWAETRVMIDKVLAGESFSGVETRRYDKDGNIVPVSLSGAIYKDRDGNPVGSVINLRNITQQKQLQELLQRAQKMEAIGTLAGGVAHDLNNILSGLVSYPELLLMDMDDSNPLKKPLMRIQESGHKAAAIVQDLLTLARRGVAVTQVLDLNHIINDFLNSPEFEKIKSYYPKIEFIIDLSPDLVHILGSPVHLSKTVMNLVANAAEAVQDVGKVHIMTANRYIDRPIRGYEDVREGDYVRCTIIDSGIGMTPDDLARIFEPFYTKKVMGRSGTGLGMAVVWGTVKDHNGYIDVQSTLGQGTRCDLYFPVTRQKLVEPKAATSLQEFAGTEKILVVDDVAEQRDIAHQILARLGYRVETVASGEDALAYLETNPVDLVVLDMIMDPGIDGLETYKAIIERNPAQKAIIASGFSETERVHEAQRLGAGEYIKKPYMLETLGRAVRKELDRLKGRAV